MKEFPLLSNIRYFMNVFYSEMHNVEKNKINKIQYLHLYSIPWENISTRFQLYSSNNKPKPSTHSLQVAVARK